MRLFNEKVFDAVIRGTEPVYTDAMYDELLGTADQLAIFAIVDQISGTNPSWQCRSEHSNDKEHWSSTGGYAEFFGAFPPGPGPTWGMSRNDNAAFLGAYVRYKIFLEGADHQAHIKLIVCGRGQQLVDVPVPFNPRP
jgi:hypothetical protein